MPLPHRCRVGIALILLATAAPALARGQNQRDADALAHTNRARLAIRHTDQGFAITRLDPAVPAQTDPAFRTPAAIAIGAALKIDRSVFLSGLEHMAGGMDARR